jgi:hypothetical protein
VAAWRGARHSDASLVRLIAYGAFAAVERIETTMRVPVTRP